MKKGMAMSTLVILIAALAGLLVMGYSLKSIADVTEGATDKQVCKQSIELKALKLKGISIIDVPLKCKSQYKFIENEKDLENTKEIIAQDMYDCWDQFGKGEIDFLDERDYFKDTYCFVCSKITITEDSLKNKKIIGLGDYLTNEKIYGLDIDYARFLYGDNFDKSLLSIYNSISLKNPIYIIYVVDRKSYPAQAFSYKILTAGIIGGAVVGCGIGAVGIVTLPLVPATCAGGAFLGGIVFPVAQIVYGATFTASKIKPYLLIGNSEEIEKICQQK